MQTFSKEERKAYNRHVRKHNEEVAVANAVAPLLILIVVGFGIWLWEFSPFLAKGCFLFAVAIFIGRIFSGAHVNDPHRDIRNGGQHDH